MPVQLLQSGRTVVAALRTADKAAAAEAMGSMGIQEGVQADQTVRALSFITACSWTSCNLARVHDQGLRPSLKKSRMHVQSVGKPAPHRTSHTCTIRGQGHPVLRDWSGCDKAGDVEAA
eukprot:1159715-Pelagomonas_calceolata.AAC.10